MKIAVYTIVKNAEPYIHKWIESAQDADLLVLGDTGSTDNTVKVARRLGAKVYHIAPETPFHFGNARQALLDKLPCDVDVCISLDADEVLTSGWRGTIEREWNGSLMSLALVDGDAAVWIPRVHKRDAHWVDRIHEYIYVNGAVADKVGVSIKHNKDLERPRDFYIELLEQQMFENPKPRHMALLGKELANRGQIEQAIVMLKAYDHSESEYMPERASVCNTLYYLTHDVKWLYKSIWYHPPQQEAYHRLAAYMAHNEDWLGAYHFASMGHWYPPLDLFKEALLTDEAFSAILAEAAFKTGRLDEAVALSKKLVVKYGDKHEANLERYANG